jgi:hypothetical protein
MVSVGFSNACGLRPDGSLVCWFADGNPGEPLFSGQFTMVSAGFGAVCGIRTDGTLACSDSIHDLDLDATYSMVDVGTNFACGLKTDGTANVGISGTFLAVSTSWGYYCVVTMNGAIECRGAATVVHSPFALLLTRLSRLT